MNLQLATKLGLLEGNTIGRWHSRGGGAVSFADEPTSQNRHHVCSLYCKIYVDFMFNGLIDCNLISVQIKQIMLNSS